MLCVVVVTVAVHVAFHLYCLMRLRYSPERERQFLQSFFFSFWLWPACMQIRSHSGKSVCSVCGMSALLRARKSSTMLHRFGEYKRSTMDAHIKLNFTICIYFIGTLIASLCTVWLMWIGFFLLSRTRLRLRSVTGHLPLCSQHQSNCSTHTMHGLFNAHFDGIHARASKQIVIHN